ncbi:M60 family peptidase N-terminal accessory domain-containing protein [Bacteroidota bacterium]
MKITSLLFVALLQIPATLLAQIGSYNFENNLDDEVAGHHGAYIEYGQVSNGPPNFASGETGMRIVLDSTQGVMLPAELTDLLDTSTSIEIRFDFVLEDIGRSQGFMYLLSNQPGVNSTGLSIFTRHDEFSNFRDYEVVFTYADGGFGTVPDHPGHAETRIGYFNEGDLVSVKLILDFAGNQWSSLLNDTYTNVPFDDYYDFDLINQSINDAEMFIGWGKAQEQDLAFDPAVFASSASFDNLRVYSPRPAGDATALRSALVAMTAHVDGSTPLSSDGLNQQLADIQLNFDGNFAAAEKEVYDFTSAYEFKFEPAYSDRQLIAPGELAPETQVLVFLQQAIHDEQFVPTNIAAMDGVKFEAADVFPGIVSPDAPRVNGTKVDVNGSYRFIQGARVAGDLDDAKRPTGSYAAPGELVTITVPASVTEAGLTAMIGAHDSDHSRLTHTNRFVRITKDFPLDSETTQIASPFGGAIYIKVPEGLDVGWFEITIDGAVRSPYFSSRTGRSTSPADWQAELAKTHVPWVDIESDKYMMTLPLNYVTGLAELADPTGLMNQWDAIMDAFNYVGGRPPERTRSEYFLVDSRLPSDAFGTGYPQVIGDDAPYGSLGSTELYPTQILKPDFHKSGIVITFHEMGHGALHPTLLTEVESIVHLNAAYIYDQLYDLPIDTAFKYSAFESLVMDEAAMDWMIADNFRNNKSMDCDPTMEDYLCHEVRYQHRGHAKYIQMADLFGWQAVHGMNKFFFEKWRAVFDNTKVVTPDEMITAASKAVGMNVAPLMHFWGLQPSSETATELASMAKSEEIRDLLEYYKSIVPANATEFQPWYDRIRAKKDPVHFARYDRTLANYDADNFAAAIVAQIDLIIATYFQSSTSSESGPVAPGEFALNQNYPNPFSASTDIAFSLPRAETVNITVFDMLGREVVQIVDDGQFSAGLHSLSFEAPDLTTGIYFYRMDAGAFSQTRTMVVHR